MIFQILKFFTIFEKKIKESFCHFIFIRFYILVIDQSNSFPRFDFIWKERFNGILKFPIIGDIVLI